jgi:hypothetical protein
VRKNTLLCFPAGLYGYDSHDDKGHLTGDYARMSQTKVEKDGKTVTLTLIAPGETRPDVRALPNNKEIAWARRALLPLAPKVAE